MIKSINKKIFFIQPTIYDEHGNLIKTNKLYGPSLTFSLLAALTPSEWEINVCFEFIEDVFFDTDADIIGLSIMAFNMDDVRRSFEIASEFKKRGKIVLAGGIMASLIPEEIKKYCDSVIIGDAEEVWKDVLIDIEKRELKPYYKKDIKFLTYPLPRYDLIANKKLGGYLPVEIGRGCCNFCSFCSISCLYRGKYVKRERDEVIRDIKHIKSLGFKKFIFVDSNIFPDQEYLEKILIEVKKLKMSWYSQCSLQIAYNDKLLKIMAESGCIGLSIGLENINKEILKDIDKSCNNPDDYISLIDKIRNYGIEVVATIMLGHDRDTQETSKKMVEFIINSNIIFPKISSIIPTPGTDFYKKMLENNRIQKLDYYSSKKPMGNLIPKNMTQQELIELYWKSCNELYSIKNIIRRIFFRKHPLKNFDRFLFFLSLNLIYRHKIKKRIRLTDF